MTNREQQAFIRDPLSGEMINVADRSRNVSFKTATFNTLLTELGKGFVQAFGARGSGRSRADQHSGVQVFESILRTGGEQCGELFGESLRASRGQKAFEGKTPIEKVNAWCAFDSSMGWGSFGVSPEVSAGELPHRFHVVIRNLFLTGQPTEQGPDLCVFMEGYIEGVIGQLLDHSVQVSRDASRGKGGSTWFQVELTG